MAASLILTLGCARAAGAQFVEFRPPPPAQVPANVPVSIAFGGDAGVDVWCATPDDYYGCQDMYVYPYDYAPPAGDLTFTVNGVSRVHDLTFTGPVDENCVPVGSYGGYYCTRTYTAAGTTQLTAGAQNTLTAALVSYAWASQTVVVAAQTGPAVTLVSPTLYRDPAQCALDCGELVQTYSTPAYVSRDVARSLTLVYRSGRARPLPVVEVDVTAPPAGTARLGLALRKPDGTALPLTHGASEAVRAYAPEVANRLAAQFDAALLGPVYGADRYALTAVVAAYDAGGTVLGTTTVAAPVLVDWLNGAASPYGAGWGVAGVQQWRTQGPRIGDGVVIAEGGGAIGYWACTGVRNGVYTFASPPGDATVVTYDDATGLLNRRYPDGTVATLSGSDGNQVGLTDRLGNTTAFAYALGGNRLTSVTDPAGQTVTLGYRGAGDPAGWRVGTLEYMADNLGRSVYFGVDGANDLRFINEPIGASNNTRANTRLWTYGDHRLAQAQDARGGVTDYAYDVAGALRSVASPVGVGPGGTGRVTTIIGSWAQAVLAGAGTPGATGLPLRADTVRASVTDAQTGIQTRYALDGWGAPTRVEAPGGVVATATRDTNGNVTRTVDARDQAVDYVWNAARPWLLDSTYDAAAKVGTRYTYDPARDYALQKVTVNGQEQQRVWTRADGRVDSVRAGGAGQAPTRFKYLRAWDARPDTVVDPRGHKTAYAYAAGGLQNAAGATSALGTSSVVRDAYGRDSVATDPLGRRTTVTYDVLNRPLAVTDPAGHTTATAYDALFPRTVTDAVGQVYRDSTNALGAPVQAVDPAGRVTQTTYDAAGRVSQVTNRRGQTVTFGYDPALGTLATRTTPDGADLLLATEAAGRWAAAETADAVDTVFFDGAGRPSTAVHVIRTPGPANGARYELTYQYDSLGRRSSMRLARPGRWALDSVRYGYNSRHQLTGLTDWAGQGTGLGYDGEGAQTGVTLPGGTVLETPPTALHASGGLIINNNATLQNTFGLTLLFDGAGRLAERVAPNGRSSKTFAYDAAGRLRRYASKSYAGGTGSGCRPMYGSRLAPLYPGEPATSYDCTYGPGGGTVTDSTNYAWDAVGNPVRPDVPAAPDAGNRIRAMAGYTLDYDADGNLTWRGKQGEAGHYLQQFAWNSVGQLTGVWSEAGYPTAGAPGGWVTFGYDGAGRRVRKTREGGATAFYLWDGDDLVAELDGNGDLAVAYTYYPGVDRPHSARVGPADGAAPVYYYVQDRAPGHVVGLVTAGGQTAARYAYEPFGVAVTASETGLGGWSNPLRFGGREFDAETGLYYQRARYYDPQLQRFLSEDPIGLAGGANLYAYAGDDPVNYRDPYGTECTAAEATKLTYTRNEDGDWVETRTCPGGGPGMGGSTTFGHGFNPLGQFAGSNPSGASANFGNLGARGGTIGIALGTATSGAANSAQSFGTTLRIFGPDGQALVDFDWHRPAPGQPSPHAHDWVNGQRQSHDLWRPVRPGELSSPWSPRESALRTFLGELWGLLQSRSLPSFPIFMVNPCAAGNSSLCRPGPA